MLRFARMHALPALVTYTAGSLEEQIFAADVAAHLLYFHTAPIDKATLEWLTAAGESLRGDALVATVDAAAHEEVASFFDVAPNGALPPPLLMGFSLASGTKFVGKSGTSAEAVAFARSVIAGTAAVHLRSQPAPEPSGPVVELVGSTFASVALDTSKDVLVNFYSKDCGHCKKLQPVYEQVAKQLAADGVVVAQLDAVANDVLGFEPVRAHTAHSSKRPNPARRACLGRPWPVWLA
jgi:thiol-disulfide isomerase/thioredoxin